MGTPNSLQMGPGCPDRDGSSPATAIPVNSVPEEYAWLREHYPGWQVASQQLCCIDDRRYDVITLHSEDGTEQRQVYFDISRDRAPIAQAHHTAPSLPPAAHEALLELTSVDGPDLRPERHSNRPAAIQPLLTATSLSTDAFAPDLMQELQAVREPFRAAYDTLWRRERAFRYVYWLEHHEHPPFNLVGSWTTPDMTEELALWQRARGDCLDNDEVIDMVTVLLEQRLDLPYESMLERASDPALAKRGLPIWNRPSESLIPQALGKWRITGMTDYKKPALGASYSYRHIDADSILSLYVYDHGLNDIQPGLSDPRFARALEICVDDIKSHARNTGCELNWYTQPIQEIVRSRHDTEIPFAATTWLSIKPDQTRDVGALSLTAFRSHFLKVRITCSEPFAESDDGQADIADLNLDLADYLEMYGP